jgi:hypothetical protein
VKTVIVTLAALALFASSPPQDPPAPLHLTAWAVNMSNIGIGSNAVVDITIERWSTDDERQTLIATFLEKGPEKLLGALQKLKRVGYIRLPNSLGYDLHFARQVALDEGGSKIVIATDRRIGFQEARAQPRSIDYPFTLIEIRLTPEGSGEGKMSLATKISFNRKQNVVELENYASEPVRLQNVKVGK